MERTFMAFIFSYPKKCKTLNLNVCNDVSISVMWNALQHNSRLLTLPSPKHFTVHFLEADIGFRSWLWGYWVFLECLHVIAFECGIVTGHHRNYEMTCTPKNHFFSPFVSCLINGFFRFKTSILCHRYTCVFLLSIKKEKKFFFCITGCRIYSLLNRYRLWLYICSHGRLSFSCLIFFLETGNTFTHCMMYLHSVHCTHV